MPEGGRCMYIVSFSVNSHITAGDNVTLSCDYSGGVNTLQWYRQYPGSQIEFLIFVTALNGRSDPALRLSSVADVRNKRINLSIFQAEMEDSALYYCALVPTVMGNTATLCKNIISSRHRSNIRFQPIFQNISTNQSVMTSFVSVK
uniref:T-cell receptor alpha/delta variable 7.0 n=1 Tax=Cyprinus carpio TaxID=7962 RepID=A0A8C1PMN7_CYPCA